MFWFASKRRMFGALVKVAKTAPDRGAPDYHSLNAIETRSTASPTNRKALSFGMEAAGQAFA